MEKTVEKTVTDKTVEKTVTDKGTKNMSRKVKTGTKVIAGLAAMGVVVTGLVVTGLVTTGFSTNENTKVNATTHVIKHKKERTYRYNFSEYISDLDNNVSTYNDIGQNLGMYVSWMAEDQMGDGGISIKKIEELDKQLLAQVSGQMIQIKSYENNVSGKPYYQRMETQIDKELEIAYADMYKSIVYLDLAGTVSNNAETTAQQDSILELQYSSQEINAFEQLASNLKPNY